MLLFSCIDSRCIVDRYPAVIDCEYIKYYKILDIFATHKKNKSLDGGLWIDTQRALIANTLNIIKFRTFSAATH